MTTFQENLKQDSYISINMRNIKTVAIEMYKVANDISKEIMKKVFNFCGEIGYDLRQQSIFRRPLVNPLYKGTERDTF